MATYRLSRRAEEDLTTLYVQGVERFGSAQADHYVETLVAAFAALTLFPEAARERLEFDPPVRIHPYRSHLVICRIEPYGVFIVRIAHAREDVDI